MKNKHSSFEHAIIYCLNLSWTASPTYTIIRTLALIIGAVLPYVSLLAIKLFIDFLSNPSSEKKTSRMVLLLVIIVLSTVLIKVLEQVVDYIQNIHSDLLEQRVSKQIMYKTLSVDVEFFDSPDYLDILQAINVDSISVCNIVWNVFYGISSLVSLAIATLMICAYNWKYAAFLLAASIPSAFLSQYFSKSLYKWRIDNLTTERQQSYIRSISSDKAHAYEMRLFDLKDFFLSRYTDLWNFYYEGHKSLRKKQMSFMIPSFLLPEIAAFCFLISITSGIITGANTVGDFSLYMGLFNSLISGTSMVINRFSAVYEDKLKVDTIHKFHQYGHTVADDGLAELKEIYEIEFKKVSFQYPKSNSYVLHDVSFRVEKDQKVCIIGTNGAGKSSIIKVLLRFYDVTSGEILINSKNIESYTIDSLRKAFSVMFQNYTAYALTLRENIQLSDLDKANWSDQDALKALDIVNAENLLHKLKFGLDTHIYRIFSKDGYEPSGGENQKIALARAVNRHCYALILDEPSASLDPESEYKLYNNLRNEFADKMIIFTSHRLFAARLADKIIMLDNGRIIEQGTHDELMKLNKEYARLYNLQ